MLAMTGTGSRRSPPTGPILSECDGHLRELVIQYEPSAKPVVAATYRDLLEAFDRDITVHVVCPNVADFQEFLAFTRPARCKVLPIVAGHSITTWARDRWVALEPARPGAPVTLLSPRGEAGQAIWPARAGDQRVGTDIAATLHDYVQARRSDLYFDGGDFLADRDHVFVVPRVLRQNLQHTLQSRDELLARLSACFRRRVILLEQSPDHHAGMFMASTGDHTMLVADPNLARNLVSERAVAEGGSAALPGGADFTPQTQGVFDAVANQCAALGYRVVRIPTVPARDGRTFLSYVNVLLDQQAGRRLVYLPFYRGFDQLNAAAREIWAGLGYEIRPVDCTDTYRHFGCLHCLVNVLIRS